jgi:hypothetical protein
MPTNPGFPYIFLRHITSEITPPPQNQLLGLENRISSTKKTITEKEGMLVNYQQ